MEALESSAIEWKFRRESALEGRALLGTHAQPPEPVSYGPVSPKHPRTHYPLVAALLILMGMAVGAICCCCYRWEGQMRVQARPRSTGHSEMTDGTEVSPNFRQNSEEFCSTNPRVRAVLHDPSKVYIILQCHAFSDCYFLVRIFSSSQILIKLSTHCSNWFEKVRTRQTPFMRMPL